MKVGKLLRNVKMSTPVEIRLPEKSELQLAGDWCKLGSDLLERKIEMISVKNLREFKFQCG